MSEPHLPATTEPLRVAIRRLRWFRAALGQHLDELTQEIGVAFTVDDRKLAAIFVGWLREIEMQRPGDKAARRVYFDHVAALMLRDLLRDMPLKAGPLPPEADRGRAEYFWPEGYALTLFCLNVRSAVLEQEFDATTTTTPEFFSIRQWWSFRENVGEDANTAIGFFDVFTGQNPDWTMPDSFRRRLDRALAAPAKATRLSQG